MPTAQYRHRSAEARRALRESTRRLGEKVDGSKLHASYCRFLREHLGHPARDPRRAFLAWVLEASTEATDTRDAAETLARRFSDKPADYITSPAGLAAIWLETWLFANGGPLLPVFVETVVEAPKKFLCVFEGVLREVEHYRRMALAAEKFVQFSPLVVAGSKDYAKGEQIDLTIFECIPKAKLSPEDVAPEDPTSPRQPRDNSDPNRLAAGESVEDAPGDVALLGEEQNAPQRKVYDRYLQIRDKEAKQVKGTDLRVGDVIAFLIHTLRVTRVAKEVPVKGSRGTVVRFVARSIGVNGERGDKPWELPGDETYARLTADQLEEIRELSRQHAALASPTKESALAEGTITQDDLLAAAARGRETVLADVKKLARQYLDLLLDGYIDRATKLLDRLNAAVKLAQGLGLGKEANHLLRRAAVFNEARTT